MSAAVGQICGSHTKSHLHTIRQDHAKLGYSMKIREAYGIMGADGKGGRVAMGLGRVQARGQVTRPAEGREALGVQPGDGLLCEVTGPDEGRFRVVGTTRWLDQYFGGYRAAGPVPASLWDTGAEDLARDAAPADALMP